MLTKKNFIRNQEGGVLIFMVISSALLITAVGLAIDAGRVFLVNSKAQTALDAAVISAASVSYAPIDAPDAAKLNALVEQRGDDFFAANFPTGYMGVTVGPNNASFAPTDDKGTAVRGELNLTVNTFFGDFAMTFFGGEGLDSVTMDEFAEVKRVIPDIDFEIALALDYTMSMCEPNCASKFAYMRESVGLLINSLESSLQATSGGTDIRYAFIPFTHTVKVDDTVKDLNLANFINSKALKQTIDTLPNLHGLKEDTSDIIGDLASIEPDTTGQAVSGTNVGVGAYWGWSALRSKSTGQFTGSSAHDKAPVVLNNDETFKMLLLLTDGENEKAVIDTSDLKDPWKEQDDASADRAQEAACAGAKREGIELRTIAFAVEDAAARKRLEECASVRDGVRFYYEVEDADDAAGLRDVFRQIANDLIDLRLSK